MSADPSPRAQLRTEPAPSSAPMIVSLAQTFSGGELILSYVPDRDVLVTASLAAYLKTLSKACPEVLAAKIAEDIANELVPRWHRVSVSLPGQIATVEDRQPGWDHPTLLMAVPSPGMPR